MSMIDVIKRIARPIYNAFCAVMVERIAYGLYDFFVSKFWRKDDCRD